MNIKTPPRSQLRIKNNGSKLYEFPATSSIYVCPEKSKIPEKSKSRK